MNANLVPPRKEDQHMGGGPYKEDLDEEHQEVIKGSVERGFNESKSWEETAGENQRIP